MKASVFLIGSIVLGVLIVVTSVGALRETGSKDQPSGSRVGPMLTCAMGVLLIVQGILGLLRKWG